MKRVLLGLIVVLLLLSPVHAFTVKTFTWTSSGAGAATSNSISVDGAVLGIRMIPGAGVSASYDMTITDSHARDILVTRGTNLSNALTGDYFGMSDLGYIVLSNETLTVNVTNAGSEVSGTVYIYME